VNADDNDDIPWGTDLTGPDDATAPQSDSTQPAAGERLNLFCVPRRRFPPLLQLPPARFLRPRWRQG